MIRIMDGIVRCKTCGSNVPEDEVFECEACHPVLEPLCAGCLVEHERVVHRSGDGG